MGIMDNAKDIAELIKKMGNMDLYEKIMGLREEIFALKEENLTFRENVKTLEEAQDIKNKMKYEAPYYWLEEAGKKEGPYCQKCYDSEGKQLRLQDHKNGHWYCLSCRSSVTDGSYSPPTRANVDFNDL